MLEIGDAAPQFCLPNQDDVNMCLKAFKGKWVVLYFYPKDSTPGCTNEACDFTETMPLFDDMDAVILGVSPDSTKSHRNFIEKKALEITLLSDTEKTAHKAYGAWGMKKNYGKEYEGVIRSTFIIDPEQKIAASWSNVRVRVKRKDGVARHVDAVRETLTQLQQG